MTVLRPAILLGFFLAFIAAGPAGRMGKEMESLILPPYLESVVFDLFSEDPGAAVEVFAPGDLHHPLTPGAAGVEEIRLGNTLKTLSVRRPAPGRWIFRKSRPGTRVKILSQQFLPRGVLLEPAGGEPLRQHDRVFLTYRVTDAEGSPLQELPGYPLSAQLVLVHPNGLRRPLVMKLHPELGPGVFRTREKIECKLSGRYWTEVVITAQDLSGRTVRVLQDRWSGFSVLPDTSGLRSCLFLQDGMDAWHEKIPRRFSNA